MVQRNLRRTIQRGPLRMPEVLWLPPLRTCCLHRKTPARPATDAERQAAFRARQGDGYRAKNAARMRASRAKQRSVRVHAERQELPEPLAAP